VVSVSVTFPDGVPAAAVTVTVTKPSVGVVAVAGVMVVVVAGGLIVNVKGAVTLVDVACEQMTVKVPEVVQG
jgi:hypothetical protein